MKLIRDRLTTLALAASVFTLNAYICWGLFKIEYLRQMGSVEGSFIGLARYVTIHWRDLTWFRLWHLGVPYANTYPPLLHWGVAAVAMLSGFSVAHAFHWVTALSYCAGPVALFGLALRMTQSRWTAFAAAAMYSAMSWSAWLIPAIALDLNGRLHPRRLQALVAYGEAPHIASMTLIPIALLMWDLALERRRAHYVLLAALSLAATVLTSWLGGFALGLMIVAHAFSRIPRWRDVAGMAAISLGAYCLAMPWATPSNIAATQFNSKNLGGDFLHTYLTFPKWCLIALAALAALKFAVKKLDRGLQFAIFFTALTASIVFAFTRFGIAVVPQPIRYHLELEMALSLLVAFTARVLLVNRVRWAIVAIGLMCVVLIPPVKSSRKYARDILIHSIDITSTAEWRIAQWLNHEWTGERVMMPGSEGFWLLAFSDVPQLNGGTEQGVVDYMARVAAFGIYYGPPYAAGRNGEYSVLWLKALGVQAVGVSGPSSGEYYKPFIDPRQFEGRLESIIQDHGDTIYRVGQPRTSLARIVPRTALAARTPESAIDVDPLRLYVAALDDPEMAHASFAWTSAHSAHIAADVRTNEVISVQIAWHKGWRSNLPVRKDAIGLLYLDPGRAGHFDVDLDFDGGLEMKIARALSAISALILVAASIVSLRRRL